MHNKRKWSQFIQQGEDEFVFNKTYFSTTNLSAVCATGESECAHEGCNFMRKAKFHRIFTKQRKIQNSQESPSHELFLTLHQQNRSQTFLKFIWEEIVVFASLHEIIHMNLYHNDHKQGFCSHFLTST